MNVIPLRTPPTARILPADDYLSERQRIAARGVLDSLHNELSHSRSLAFVFASLGTLIETRRDVALVAKLADDAGHQLANDDRTSCYIAALALRGVLS